MKCTLSLLVLVVAIGSVVAEEKQRALPVWPGKVPGEKGDIGEEKEVPARPGQRKVIRLTNVTRPTLTLFPAPKDNNTGAAVIVCPGGGYHILAWDLEGTEVAQWLNSIGINAIVLKYRVPRRPGQPRSTPPVGPIQDAQRAISLVRSKAKEWQIDGNRLGILGFSAGGHLSARAATNFDKRSYEPIDAVDRISCRPDFAVLVYPAYLIKKGTLELSSDIRVSKTTPPVFFAHASNDRVLPQNSIAMFLALKRAGVASELHIYTKGGHGFGLRKSKDPCCTWPARCAEWLKSLEVIK